MYNVIEEPSGKIFVSQNNVESDGFVIQEADGRYAVYTTGLFCSKLNRDVALRILATRLGTWLTMPEARAALVEAGVIKNVSDVQFCRWLAAGRFTGAKKVAARGRGGSWRVPLSAIEEMIAEQLKEVQ